MERSFSFNTAAEATAYREGVEWANDSSIRFVRTEDSGCTVVFFDEDAHE